MGRAMVNRRAAAAAALARIDGGGAKKQVPQTTDTRMLPMPQNTGTMDFQGQRIRDYGYKDRWQRPTAKFGVPSDEVVKYSDNTGEVFLDRKVKPGNRASGSRAASISVGKQMNSDMASARRDRKYTR